MKPLPVLRATVTTVGQDSNLDILRSVAVLIVFLCHLLQVLAGSKLGEHLAYGVETYSLGRVGVLIFFVHTSLVLMQSIERTHMSGVPLFRYFYLKRAFRIYPLSICLILIAVAFSIPANALGVPYEPHGAGWFLANILLIQNIAKADVISSPLWSLPFEVQMYLVLPLLFLALRSPKGTVRLAAIYITSVILSIAHPLFRFVPCFLGGVIAYRLLGTIRPRFPSWLWCPAVIGFVMMYTISPAPSAIANWSKDLLVCLVAGSLIPLFRRQNGAIAIAASHIAKYSYGIYLCHTPVLWLLYRKLTLPGWQRAIWLMIAMVVVPVACYYLIEHPLIRLGTRFASKVPATPLAAARAA